MIKNLLALTLSMIVFMGTNTHAKSVYTPWYTKIDSMISATPHVYMYQSGTVEINPAGCSDPTGYVLHADTKGFEETYKALLSAFISETEVRIVLDDGPAASTCYGGKPKIKWIQMRR